MKLCSDIYFTKKCIQILEYCVSQASGTEQVEYLQFYLGGIIWVTGLSGAFDYNQMFLGTFTTGMSKLHQFLLTFCESKMT